jgi:hypothetical protein
MAKTPSRNVGSARTDGLPSFTVLPGLEATSDTCKRAQMVMQLAYALTYGYNVATYEAAAVRRFALGRTETVRVCTPQSAAW